MRRIVCLAIIMSVVLMCFAVEVSSSFPSEEEFRLLKALEFFRTILPKRA